jgi:hypothetical protein
VGGFLLTLAIATVPLAQADNGKAPNGDGIDVGFARDINGILGEGNGFAGRARGQEKGQEHGQGHGNGHALTTFRAATKSALDAYNAVIAPAEATRQAANDAFTATPRSTYRLQSINWARSTGAEQCGSQRKRGA